jgi:hypothetical protein
LLIFAFGRRIKRQVLSSAGGANGKNELSVRVEMRTVHHGKPAIRLPFGKHA